MGGGRGRGSFGAEGSLARLLDALPYVVYVYDRVAQRVLYENRSMAQELGYSAEEAAAMGDRVGAHLMHPDDRAQALAQLARWAEVRDGEVLEAEFRMRHADGSWRHFTSLDVVLDREADGSVRTFIGTALDVTAHVQLEQALARSQILEAVGRLAGGVSHDFNNLLTVIMANVALARRAVEAGKPAEVVADLLAQIGRVADDAARLTRQLLTFARQQPSRPEVVDANALISELAPALRRLIEENVELHWQLAPDAPPVSIDRVSFTQVLLNLAANARDAMRHGGRLTVRTARAAPGNDRLLITVEDTGEGMPVAVLERAFDPFFTTKEPGAGTGLGLSTVYGIVRQAGGTITAHSDPGHGTRFELLFPAAPASEPAAPPRDRPAEAAPPRGVTLLLVEDNAALAEATATYLEDVGHRVRVATDGRAGLALFRRHADEIELVISDVVMPRMSGIDLAAELRREKPGLKVILWSGYPEDEDGLAPDAGLRFVRKPLLPEKLVEVISELLQGN